MEKAKLALQDMQSSGTSSAILIFDVDNFKSVNDTHGHDVGDEALRIIASIASSQMGPEDVLARLGGEEFVALLANTTLLDAVSAVERLRQAISVVEVPSSRGALPSGVGVSILSAEAYVAEQAMKRADASLYRAKAEGRNLVRYDPALALG